MLKQSLVLILTLRLKTSKRRPPLASRSEREGETQETEVLCRGLLALGDMAVKGTAKWPKIS